MPESVVMLHGFSGTHRAWDGVIAALDGERYRPLPLDLPGHGRHGGGPRAVTFAGCVEHVLGVSPERFTLCGYSLGGRIALHVALAAPERVERLVLVSCSAGIEGEHERAARAREEEALARELETGSFEWFIERWRTQRLFAEEPPEVGELARADQRRNEPLALAAVLRGVGAGQMQPLWDRLGELSMPTAVLAGRRDEKYIAIATRMAELLPEGELMLLDGGHGLVLENPPGVAGVIEAHPTLRSRAGAAARPRARARRGS